MSAIRGRGNRSTELLMASILRRHRVTGWRRHAELPGRPDFVFRGVKVALFVDGCFWHGCPRCYAPPRTNAKFWRSKVEGNRERDRRVNRALRADGWRVIRVWEHSLKRPAAVLRRLRAAIAPDVR